MDAPALVKTPEALRLYAQVLDNMVEGVSLSDEEGIIWYTNPAEDRIFGYERGELVGKHLSVQNTYPLDENVRIVNEVIEQLKARGYWEGELSNRKKDGTPFTTFSRITAVDLAGREYWVCVQEDVTERRRAEEVLAARVRQQAAVAELGQRALAELDLPALMDEAVASMTRTLGTDFCEILELLPDGTQLLLRAGVGWQEGLVGRATVTAGYNSQAGYTLASNEPVIVEDLRTETRFSPPPLLVEHEAVSGMTVIIHGRERPFGVLGTHTTRRRVFTKDDIYFLQAVANVLAAAIERARVEEELRESRDQLEVILQGVADGITVQVRAGKLIYANDAAVRLIGYPSQEALLAAPQAEIRAKFELLDEKQQPLPYTELPGRYALQGLDAPARTVGWRIVATGELRWSLVKAAPVKNEHGEVLYAVSIFRDITDRIEREQRKDDFIALASHELKTPITSLKIYAQSLKRRLERVGEGGEHEATRGLALDVAKQLGRMDEQLDNLTELVRDLLDVSKIEAGKLDYNMGDLDVDELVRAAVEDLQRISEKHTIVLQGPAEARVFADGERIKQVLTNLITNAIKYSPQADRLVVSVGRGGGGEGTEAAPAAAAGEVVVAVKDFGIGIPSSAHDKIFDRFFQVDNSAAPSVPARDTYPGLGLGLYISSEIVKRHGGRIWVDSEMGKGSTFYFTLPVKAEWTRGQPGVVGPPRT